MLYYTEIFRSILYADVYSALISSLLLSPRDSNSVFSPVNRMTLSFTLGSQTLKVIELSSLLLFLAVVVIASQSCIVLMSFCVTVLLL